MKISKLAASAIALIALLCAGCSNSYKEVSFPTKPKELEDCKIYELSNDSGKEITVMRCPNSATSTTYRVGKHYEASIVIDSDDNT